MSHSKPSSSSAGDCLRLNQQEQDDWLDTHLPNRIGAAWVWLPGIEGEWQWRREQPLQSGQKHRDFAEHADPHQVWCIGRAAENGQKAAMRWLIEFVGISLAPNGQPARPNRRITDVSIRSFSEEGSHKMIPLEVDDRNSRAWILGKVWKGCTQSTVHATVKTAHYRADPPQLAEAFVTVVEHLQVELYDGRRKKRISQIIREMY